MDIVGFEDDTDKVLDTVGYEDDTYKVLDIVGSEEQDLSLRQGVILISRGKTTRIDVASVAYDVVVKNN